MAHGPRPGQRGAQPAHTALLQSQRAIGRAVSDGGAMSDELILNINGRWHRQVVGQDGQEHMEPYTPWTEEPDYGL